MRTRFAPSPTGYLHIGGVRTALFSWLWSKKNHGDFILRIEDTDTQRSKQKYTDAILESMDWLGLDYTGPYYQSTKSARYNEVIDDLLDNDKAYYCDCSKERLDKLRNDLMLKGEKPKYDGNCRHKNNRKSDNTVIRFKNPSAGSVIFDDLVKGKIAINNNELDDLIIARSDKTPTYNLTVVVDDYDMAIDSIIRGDDHINNTPRQINLYQALGWNVPEFAHIPMILGSDGTRLSKRHGALDVMQYHKQGYLPEALLNYLVRLGWSYGDKEVFSINEMIDLFELNKINKAAASFNADKLLWLNKEYIKNSDVSKVKKHLKYQLDILNIKTNNNLDAVINLLKERSKTLKDMAEQSKMFFTDFSNFDKVKASKIFTKDSKVILENLITKLNSIDNWTKDNVHKIIKQICAEQNVGFAKVGQPFRLALSGDGNAGSIDITAELVGKQKTLQRLNMAIDFIKGN